jgi:hypothetical protein
MAMEPMTLFARIADPAGVAGLLRERVPTVEIDGQDGGWSNAVVTFGTRKLTFTHDPAYYAEPNWSVQMNGMHDYFARFPETDRKDRALMLTTTFTFSLGLLFDPDYDPEDDPRLDVVFAVAEFLDGVLFTPSAFRDARGRILYGAGGEDAEDPEAVWPRVIAAVKFGNAAAPKPSTDEPPTPRPTPARVARRALALTAVTARAILEQGGVNLGLGAPKRNPLTWVRHMLAGQQSQYQNLLTCVKLLGIDDEFEPDEWQVLQRSPGRLDQEQQIHSTWRLEGLGILAWALGRFDIPPHDQLVECHSLWHSLGMLDVGACKGLLVNAVMRPLPEIQALRRRLLAINWRLTNYYVRPTAIDFVSFTETSFAGFDRTAWFSPQEILGLPLVDGDLAIQGTRLDRATQDTFHRTRSIAHERHVAVNWLLEGPERYSEASADT